ncbi:MAG: DNA recombination protein RmuC [Ruminococcaceae bacterium]|nr:DNA recombination protein RmuC [Oscillospiraceae bacterium]
MDNTLLTVLLLLNLLLIVVVIVLIVTSKKKNSQGDLTSELRNNRMEINANLTSNVSTLSQSLKNSSEMQTKLIKSEMENSKVRDGELKDTLLETLKTSERHTVATLEMYSEKLGEIRTTLETRVKALEEANSKKLDEMRMVVDEKLQSTLEERISRSFKEVSERLEQVYKGLGEMQTLATGVGDLKKVLSNVKTRGILGEIQLGSILEEILAPEQYEKNVITVSGSQNPVEFAVKLPGTEEKSHVYLPIDAKFPSDAYVALSEAYESGNAEEISSAKSVLVTRIKKFADDIRKKYISPPATTEFAIMFLPTEGLYAEAVRLGLVEILQKDYNVTIAGPTTMAALLNSLQMGFKTLAIQKRSGEVWNTLSAVKTEFGKFEDVLIATQKKLDQATGELETLVGTRTRMIRRKLRDITDMPEDMAATYFPIGETDISE